MAQNSLRWGAFQDQNEEEWLKGINCGGNGKGLKGEIIRGWNMEWEDFCHWIVENYGREWLPKAGSVI